MHAKGRGKITMGIILHGLWVEQFKMESCRGSSAHSPLVEITAERRREGLRNFELEPFTAHVKYKHIYRDRERDTTHTQACTHKHAHYTKPAATQVI